MVKEKTTIVNWSTSLTEEEQRLLAEGERGYVERQQAHIMQARKLEPLFDATVVGVWGYQTGSGGREHAVYKRNNEEAYFIVTGRKEDEFETKPFDPDTPPNQVKMQPVGEYLAGTEEEESPNS